MLEFYGGGEEGGRATAVGIVSARDVSSIAVIDGSVVVEVLDLIERE
jgi:hypothetical protein